MFEDELPADEGAGEQQEGLMDSIVAVVADEEAAVAVQPGEVALDDPSIAAQLLARVDPPPGDAWDDAPAAQRLAAAARVEGLVGVELGRATAGPAARLADRRDGVDQPLQDGAFVHVGRGLQRRQRDALALAGDVVLGAWPAAIRRVRPDVLGRWPPFLTPLAGTLAASALARLQSILPAAPNRSRSTSWSRRQTPACCQARRRRQQVIPLPQPISWGRSSHGIPVFKTKMMPVSAARSDTVNGCPPFGWAGFGGSSGSTMVQSSSLTSGLAIPRAQQIPGPLC
jgi:hypothetical protein